MNGNTSTEKTSVKLIRQITQQLGAIVPVMLMSTGEITTKKFIVIILPIFMLLINYIISDFDEIIDYFKSFFKKKNKTSNLESYYIDVFRYYGSKDYRRNNQTYNCLLKFINVKIIKEDKISASYCQETNWVSDYNYDPVLEVPKDVTVKYIFEETELYIEFNMTRSIQLENDIECIRIRSNKSLHHINEFIGHVMYFCTQEVINRNKKRNQIYEYNPKKDEWIGKDILINKNFKNLFLSKKNHEMITQSIDFYKNSKDIFVKGGIPYKKGFLFYGVPGTGKSSAIFALANELKRNIYKIPNLVPSCEDSENNSFVRAICKIPKGEIIVIEEMDTIYGLKTRSEEEYSIMSGCMRKDKDNKIINMKDYDSGSEKDYDSESTYSSSDSYKHISNDKDKNLKHDANGFITDNANPALKQYLALLDGYNILDDCVIVGTTNHIEKLDKAIIRSGRFDHLIELKEADRDQIKDIFKLFFPEYQIDESVLEETERKNKTTSYIINSVILANLDSPENALKMLLESE